MKDSKFARPLDMNNGRGSSVPRNAFDMSYHSYFTSPAGLLLPNYVQDVQPGDFLKLDVTSFARTLPVNTAAFSRFKEVTDFYFVPYRLLWRWFDQLYTQVDDISTNYKPAGAGAPTSVPYLTAANIKTQLDSTTPDLQGFQRGYFVDRFLDLLGYPVSNDAAVTTSSFYGKLAALSVPPTFNPFRILAYQRIYNDFYRNTDYDANDPDSFNIDSASGGSVFHANMFTPRYALWKRDRFTTSKPQPLFSPVNQSVLTPRITEGVDGTLIHNDTLKTVVDLDGTGIISMNQLRAGLAYDRLARLTMLSKKTYADQIKSHFGVEPDNCDYCKPRYLGSFDSSLNIGEVTATSSGSDGASTNVLGQIAGKGIVSGRTNRPIASSFNEPGLVLGMHYFIPFSEYDSNRVDDFNIKFNRADFYTPEYDALGMQPLYGANVVIDANKPASLNQVLGWQTRYLEYKTRVDEVHGQFQSKQPLSYWASARTSVLSSSIIGSSTLHVNPKITDSIFALDYTGRQTTDPFLCHFRFDASLVRNMSTLGIPTL